VPPATILQITQAIAGTTTAFAGGAMQKVNSITATIRKTVPLFFMAHSFLLRDL
jgi:hypothetical protein